MDTDSPQSSDFSWYPGHIALTRRKIREHIRQADLVVEILDSRIPVSSRSPGLEELLERRPRLLILNKADLAHPQITRYWQDCLRQDDILDVRILSALKEPGARQLLAWLAALKPRLRRRRIAHRVVVLGLPNVGKSRFINRLLGQRKVKVADRPGLTRGPQWINLPGDFALLDLPGVVYPASVEGAMACHLALCHVVPLESVDALASLDYLARRIREGLPGIDSAHPFVKAVEAGHEDALGQTAEAWNMRIRGGDWDRTRCLVRIFKEFSQARLGRVSLEEPANLDESKGVSSCAD